jgi:hypothetical protein
MRIVLIFIFLVFLYGVFRALGREGRAMLWALLKRHVFPVGVILALTLFVAHLSLMGAFDFSFF